MKKSKMKKSKTYIIAEALANAKGKRLGIPPRKDVLEYMTRIIAEELMDDARAVMFALRKIK